MWCQVKIALLTVGWVVRVASLDSTMGPGHMLARPGASIYFDGHDDYASVFPGFQLLDDWTIEFWVNLAHVLMRFISSWNVRAKFRIMQTLGQGNLICNPRLFPSMCQSLSIHPYPAVSEIAEQNSDHGSS